MQNKEPIYDEVLKPLVDRIYDLAKEHGIPFLLAFEVSDETIVGSYSLPEGTTDQLKLAGALMEYGVPKVVMALADAQMGAVPTKVHD